MQQPDLKLTNPDVGENIISISSVCQQTNVDNNKKCDTEKIIDICGKYTQLTAQSPESPWHSFSDPFKHFSCHKLSRLQKNIIHFLHEFYFSREKPCYMKMRNLAKKFNVSITSLRNCLLKLEKRKIIIKLQWFDIKKKIDRAIILPNCYHYDNLLQSQALEEILNSTFLSKEKNSQISNSYQNDDPPSGNDDPPLNIKENQRVNLKNGVFFEPKSEREGGHRLVFNIPKSLAESGVYKYTNILCILAFNSVLRTESFNLTIECNAFAAANAIHSNQNTFSSNKELCIMNQKPIKYDLKIKPSFYLKKNTTFDSSSVDMPFDLKQLIIDARDKDPSLIHAEPKKLTGLLHFLDRNTFDFDFDKLLGRQVAFNQIGHVAARGRKLVWMYAETFLAQKNLDFDLSERLINYWNELCDSKRMGRVVLKKNNRIQYAIAFTYHSLTHSEDELKNVLNRIKKFSNTRVFSELKKIRLEYVIINAFNYKKYNKILNEKNDIQYQSQVFKYTSEHPDAVKVTRDFFIDTFYHRDRRTGLERFNQYEWVFAQFTDSLIQQISVFKKEMCGLKLLKVTGSNGSSSLPVLFEYMNWFAAIYPLKIFNLCNLEMFTLFVGQEIRGKKGYADFWKNKSNQLKNA